MEAPIDSEQLHGSAGACWGQKTYFSWSNLSCIDSVLGTVRGAKTSFAAEPCLHLVCYTHGTETLHPCQKQG